MLEKVQFKIVAKEKSHPLKTSKFGGIPDWDLEGRWPLGPSSGTPMTFLAQIKLEPLFKENKTVLLFFESESEPLYDEAFAWIIIDEDGNILSQSFGIDFSTNEGVRLSELDKDRQPKYLEYILKESKMERENPVHLNDRYQPGDLDYTTGYNFSHPELAGDKLGGQPLYVDGLSQAPDTFKSCEWELLMQLAPEKGYWDGLQPNFYPFLMELGEFGILTIFISSCRSKLRIHIQQP